MALKAYGQLQRRAGMGCMVGANGKRGGDGNSEKTCFRLMLHTCSLQGSYVQLLHL